MRTAQLYTRQRFDGSGTMRFELQVGTIAISICSQRGLHEHQPEPTPAPSMIAVQLVLDPFHLCMRTCLHHRYLYGVPEKTSVKKTERIGEHLVYEP